MTAARAFWPIEDDNWPLSVMICAARAALPALAVRSRWVQHGEPRDFRLVTAGTTAEGAPQQWLVCDLDVRVIEGDQIADSTDCSPR